MRLDRDTQYIKRIELRRDAIPSFKVYPFTLSVVKTLHNLTLHPNVTFIVGKNGVGKSTLLEAIAIHLGYNPEGGTKNFNFISYPSHSNLDAYLRIAKGPYLPEDGFFFRAESYYNLATNIEELDSAGGGRKIIDGFGGESLHQQSHGESFFAAFNHRFRGKGLYILDEPESALSPLRQLSILARIHELVEQESQFIISTHSSILMAYPNAKILELSVEGMEEKPLEKTGHYTIMKQFFEDKDRLLHHLFNEDMFDTRKEKE
ncbi:AAA family ATPase [Oceanobacillus piezotolerans]|uniref:AAA family ATPase n=1 Tax=Oceanobacillus piezotolerans TaxID=2448030 RepID=A0A498D580_9BACI|nr:AAA family ATPase [Oceanobacillus piezotolerans]RLL44878.1 AAA family ATPase [Oceanobacillus piezotolerans]